MSAGKEGETVEHSIVDKDGENPDEINTPLRNEIAASNLLVPKKGFGCIDSNLVLISLICFLVDTVTGNSGSSHAGFHIL